MFEHWINQAKRFESNDGVIEMESGEATDFFSNPLSLKTYSTAPLCCVEAPNHFTFSCKLHPHFSSTYDAGGLMIYQNDSKWIKFAFEQTDLGYPSVVSVVTDGTSDGSNGESITQDTIWSQRSCD